MVETNLPILFLRDVVLLPYNELRIEFSKEHEKRILEISERRHDNHILFVNLVDTIEEKPNLRKLPKIGILGKIKTKIVLPNGVVRIVVVGIDRVEVLNYIEDDNNMYEAFVIPNNMYSQVAGAFPASIASLFSFSYYASQSVFTVSSALIPFTERSFVTVGLVRSPDAKQSAICCAS